MGKAKSKPVAPPKKDPNKIEIGRSKARNETMQQVINERAKGTGGAGAHKNREQDVEKGRGKPKHKKDYREEGVRGASERVADRYEEASYSGNPDGKPIYPNEIDHGYDEPLAGGTDVMKRLQNRFLYEQGNTDQIRPTNPVVQSTKKAYAEIAYDACVAYLDANLVKFPKKSGWWLPAHNLGINMTMLGGLNLWVFSALPMFPDKRTYIPEGSQGPVVEPAGLRLSFNWSPHPQFQNKNFPATLETAGKLVDLIQKQPTVGEIVKKEMKWVETHFGIALPVTVESPYVLQAAKIAARRWDQVKTPDTFVPLDGRKAVPMPSWGRPQMKTGSLAVSVASRYIQIAEE